MALLYGRAGRLTAKNGDFRPGQMPRAEQQLRSLLAQVTSDLPSQGIATAEPAPEGGAEPQGVATSPAAGGADAPHRPREALFFAVACPPRWVLQKELAAAYCMQRGS